MLILALSAWKGSGKDTIAKFLVENHNFIRIAFADVLKDMVSEQYGIDRDSLDDPLKKESPILTMPVESKDNFSEMIQKFMIREFRDKNGDIAKGLELMPELYWTPRALAILEGSVKRSAQSSYWVQRALSRAKYGGRYVITDMRYRSELQQIKQHAQKTDQKVLSIRVERYDSSPSTDPSERDLDNTEFDRYITNRSNLSDLQLLLNDLVKNL